MSTLHDRPPPSAAAIAIATAMIAGITGYFIGQASTLGLFSSVKAPSTHQPNSATTRDSSSEDSDETLDELQELRDFPGNNEECKLVLVVRTDLGMTKGTSTQRPSFHCSAAPSPYHHHFTSSNSSLGKIAAQASHATLACYKALQHHSPASSLLRRWERYGQAKVALQARGEEELEVLQAQAVSLGLCAQVIHDAGRTQIAAGSATVLGVGPGPKSVIDQVTGHLKLL